MTLQAQNIRVALDRRVILDGMSLSVEKGELVALIGPNGAGKSTAMRALAGLLPLQGGVLSHTHLGDRERARLRAYLAQDASVHWPITAERLVALGRLPHLGAFQRPGAQDQHAIEAAMEATECLPFRDRCALYLSAGERARILLARALANEADYLLADEPVASLDPYHAFHMMELLAAEAKKGRGVMVVLHDLTLAARFADRLVLMKGGAVIAEGGADVVLSDANLARTYGIHVARGPGWIAPTGRISSGAMPFR